MNKLNVHLENCYGIPKLDAEFDFSSQNTYQIYASNGTMKTSFTKTFSDIVSEEAGEEMKTKDLRNNTKISKREITDQDGKNLNKDLIVIMDPYNKIHRKSTELEKLLINKKIKEEFVNISNDINTEKLRFLKGLKDKLKISEKLIENEIISVFDGSDINTVLTQLKPTIDNIKPNYIKDLNYSIIFNEKVISFLTSKEIVALLEEYVEKYNEIINTKAKYLKPGFDSYNANEIKEILKKHKFFEANHFITLVSKSNDQSEPIKNLNTFENIITEEINLALTDPELKERWLTIENKLKPNESLRNFKSYILNNKMIIHHLIDLKKLKQDFFLQIIYENYQFYISYIRTLQKYKSRIKEISKIAKNELPIWKEVISDFKDKFMPTYEVSIDNLKEVNLNGAPPKVKLKFLDDNSEFDDTDEVINETLSSGELRALYLLNIIFDIKVRERDQKETLFIIDDIADSFDYKNKYAIIEYLKEISKNPLFKFIILTHNFDFYRALLTRGIVTRNNCLCATRTNTEINITRNPEGIKNIFKKVLCDNLEDNKNIIALIPFVRNLIEYSVDIVHPISKKEKQITRKYGQLCCILHIKPTTKIITISQLSRIFKDVINKEIPTTQIQPNQKIFYLIMQEADDIINSLSSQNNNNNSQQDGFKIKEKLILSIAIRLKAEEHMIKIFKKKGIAYQINIAENQTYKLFEKYQTIPNVDKSKLSILNKVILMTPENIHLNSFMYEPIIDMSIDHLVKLYKDIKNL